MVFLCFGMGAIGTYIGGSLALSGQRVVFIERPQVAEEVRQRGLWLKIGRHEYHLEHIEVAGSLSEALASGPFDAAILAVKSYDTEAVVAAAARYSAQMPPVLCLQNGVENEALITAVLGSEKVVAGTVTTAVGRISAGKVVVEKLRGVGIATDHPLGNQLVAVLDQAGLRARPYPNAASLKWSKLLTNLLANASSAILDMTPLEIFAHPGLYRLEILAFREALAVMSAQSIAVVDLPATPVRALAGIVQFLPLALSRPLLQRTVGKGRGEKMPSFHIDLHSGRGQSEVGYLNGAVVRFGQKYDLKTPVNLWLTTTLLDMTAGRLSRSTYSRQPEKLIHAIQSAEINT